jgi:hypothetical protein
MKRILLVTAAALSLAASLASAQRVGGGAGVNTGGAGVNTA